jgi:hypothetical protein
MKNGEMPQEDSVGALIAMEAKGIQTWIFAGGKLRDLAGGSDALEQIPTGFLDAALTACGIAFPDVRKLGAKAGGFRLLLRDLEKARKLTRLLPILIQEWAPGLRYALAMEEFSGKEPDAANYEALDVALRHAGGLAQVELPPATPLVLRAQRTGLPAVRLFKYKHPAPGDTLEAVDAPTYRRRQVFEELKPPSQYDSKEGRPSSFKSRLFKSDSTVKADFAHEINEITGGTGYLGLVHADGNGLGQLVLKLTRPEFGLPSELFAALSEGIRNAAATASRIALEEIVPDLKTCQTIPVRPIVLGGDDATFLMPAHLAVGFTKIYLREFAKETKEPLERIREKLGSEKGKYVPRKLTACAGIALVKDHYPFDQASALAHSLCDFAKDQSRQGDEPTLSSLAFFRVTSTVARDFRDILADDLSVGDPGGRRRLTLAPYRVRLCGEEGVQDGTLPWLDHLMKLRDVVASLPRGAWRELATLVRENDVMTHSRYRRLLEVAADLRDRDVPNRRFDRELEAALASLGCDDATFAEATSDRPRRTPVLDVTTLLAIDASLTHGETIFEGNAA